MATPKTTTGPPTFDATLRRLASLYERWGGGAYTIGETMTITQHSAQAARCAQQAGERDAVIVAALFHDVGHLLGFEAGLPAEMDGCGFEAHDVSGGAFLGGLGFSEDVAYLASRHVEAKRYLVAVDPSYAAKLSPASATTLRFQGGPMSTTEVAAREADARWPEVLRLRAYDEAAKDAEAYAGVGIGDILAEHSESLRAVYFEENATEFSYLLSSEQLRKWDADGYVAVPGAASHFDLDAMASALTTTQSEDDESTTSDGESGRLHSTQSSQKKRSQMLVHRELTASGRAQLCRVENFCKNDDAWSDSRPGGLARLVKDLVSQVYREEAVLFKDKLNFKGPGGAGFLLHQDATAYATDDLATRHVSALVAVDAATVENGALQIAPGRHAEGVFEHKKGVILDDVHRSFKFEHVLAAPGDVVLFDSFLPHKSDGNDTAGWRRSAYLTFNKASEGDFHAAYYAKKAQLMQKGTISINDDFGGVIVD